MGKIERFEDLIAWQKARLLTKRIYEISKATALAKDWGLSAQMQRAAVSIMSNIAEGYGRNTTAEYHQFLVIAHGSCEELRSQLYVALDVGYFSPAQFTELHELADETARIVGGLRAAIARRLK